MILNIFVRRDVCQQTDGNVVRCVVSIDDCVISDAVGDNNLTAKRNAAHAAVKELKTKCWTIFTKQEADTDELGLSHSIVDEDTSKSEVVPDSNIGSKLLKSMGWTGGGIGKHGTGIAEPVSSNTIIDRQGLGFQASQNIGHSFPGIIRKHLISYHRSGGEKDITFAPDFSREERAIIHKEAQKLGLKTRSYGTGEERFLVVARKRDQGQLFQHIKDQGGETNKYKLLPPTSILYM